MSDLSRRGFLAGSPAIAAFAAAKPNHADDKEGHTLAFAAEELDL